MVGAVGAAKSAQATRKAGREEVEAANFEAGQLEQRARDTEAVGSFRADRIRAEVEKLMSKNRAAYAAGGGDTMDQSFEAVETANIKDATIDQLLVMADAKDSAQKDRIEATERRRSGKARGSIYSARATAGLLSDTGSLLTQVSGYKWGA